MPKLNAETFTGPLFLLGASLVAMASMVAVVVSSPSEAQDRTVVTLPAIIPSDDTTTSSTVAPDTTPPPIFVNAGLDGSTVEAAGFTVAGTTEPGTQMTVNGVPVVADASGNWSFAFTLNLGPNSIPIKASDAAGNESTLTITVTYALPVVTTTTTAPPPPPPTSPPTTKPKTTNPPTTAPPTTPPPTTSPPTTQGPPVDTGP